MKYFTIEKKSTFKNDCIRLLQKKHEILRKKIEFLKIKTKFLMKKKSLKKQLSKKVNCSIYEKLYVKSNVFYLHLQFENEKY